MKKINICIISFLCLIAMCSVKSIGYSTDDIYIWNKGNAETLETTSQDISNEGNNSRKNENKEKKNNSKKAEENKNEKSKNESKEKNNNPKINNEFKDENNNKKTKGESNDKKSKDDKNSLNLESESAILIEQTTGQVLYGHNIHKQLRPASVTKVMSMLLIMEALDSGKIALTNEVPCSKNASSMGGSQIWLDPKETLTVDEMLKAICLNSANDCVVAMGEYIAGSEEAFVQMMNDKAKQLGMSDTTFKNCHGLDEDGHVSSSYDIALMSRELLIKHPQITKYTTMWMETLRDGKTQLSNTNKLIKNYNGATGLKTGSTSLALYNLSASATRNGLSLIAVVMKAPTTKIRFGEAQKLLDYGFKNFSYKEFGKKGTLISTVNINKGVKSTIPAILEESSGVILEKGKEKDVEQLISINENISAPIKKGDKLGEVSFVLKGEVISKTNLIAQEDVDKINIVSMIKNIYFKWFNLLR